MRHRPFSRRAFLSGALAAPLVARVAGGDAWAFGDSSRFIPAVAQHKGHWDARLSGLRRIAWELQRRTSVEVIPDARPFPLSSPKLFEYPFLYLGSDGELPPLTDAEVENLRRYLTFGGFLLADSNAGTEGSAFDQSFRREMARVLPQAPLQPVPREHVVYKTFYLLDVPAGRVLVRPELESCNLGKRAAVIYSQNDLAGAWTRDETGTYEFEVTPGGEHQRELATRMGINLCMYALCLDYKDDAVHLKSILERRR
ncbi:MAG: DUF4159 domain-containing protein [Myxococcaceae bacterium]|nr:DUF4159 domain-containing protein [Myxococcaceae bacterium]